MDKIRAFLERAMEYFALPKSYGVLTWRDLASAELIAWLLDRGYQVSFKKRGLGYCGTAQRYGEWHVVFQPQPTVGAVLWRLLREIEGGEGESE